MYESVTITGIILASFRKLGANMTFVLVGFSHFRPIKNTISTFTDNSIDQLWVEGYIEGKFNRHLGAMIMKVMSLLVLMSISLSSFAAATNTSTTSGLSLTQKVKKAGFGLTLENDSFTVNDDKDIKGYETSFLVEPSYKVSKTQSVSIGAQYRIREFETISNESKNRDHFDESFVKYSVKTLSTRNGDLMDLKLQARIYNNEDDFFKQKYSNDGNYQLRAYMGTPIAGKLFINKYTSYLRFKKYDVNQNINKYTREYELRARISPTYSLSDKVALGTTFTYNHLFMTEKTDSENVDMSLSARFTPSRTYAILVRADYDLNETNKNGDLVAVENIGDTVGYALTLTAFY